MSLEIKITFSKYGYLRQCTNTHNLTGKTLFCVNNRPWTTEIIRKSHFPIANKRTCTVQRRFYFFLIIIKNSIQNYNYLKI